MRKRLLKYLKRFLIVIAILGTLGLIAFTWICYWPFEGEVTDLEQLLPFDTEFVVRGRFEEIRDTDWIQQNVLAHPLHGSLKDFTVGNPRDRRAPSWPKVKRQIEELNDRIQGQIPLGIVDFDIERDVLAGDIVIAGSWCAGTRPPAGPQWQELLVLKRLSWKPRAGLAAALGNEWIRDMALEGQRMEFKHFDGDIFKITLLDTPVRPELERSGCGRGFVMPPDNEWYITRIKDVVAFSNSPKMMKDVAHLGGLGDNHNEGFRSREWFELEGVKNRVAAAIDMDPLHDYFQRALEEGLGPRRQFLQHYLLPDSFERMNGRVDLDSTEQLVGRSRIRLNGPRVEQNEGIRSVYRLPQVALNEGLANFVPAESTWLSATVRAPPMHFFKSVLSMLTPNERALLDDNVRGTRNERGEKYSGIEELLGELTPRLGETAWVAVGRIDEVFDKVEYREWFPASDEPEPDPAFAFMMRIREGATLAEVDDFLQGKAAAMGFKKEFERKKHAGIPYTRLHMIETTADYELVQPCYYLAQDRFIFCNNEIWFRKVLEAIADPSKSLARSEKFRVAMAKVAPKGHLGLYVDLASLFAVPKSRAKGAGPRGHLWDMRNITVTDPIKDREKAKEKLAELVKAFKARHGRQPRDLEMDKLYDQRDSFMTSWRRGYPQLVEDYRRKLRDLERLSTLAVSLGAFDGELDAQLLIQLKPPPDGE